MDVVLEHVNKYELKHSINKLKYCYAKLFKVLKATFKAIQIKNIFQGFS